MNQVDELRSWLVEKITPDDVIGALISQFNHDLFPKDLGQFHEAIDNLKRKYPEMLESFKFDYSGLSPFSDLLDRVLNRFEACSIIGTLNPTYLVYSRNEEAIEEIKNSSLNKFSEEQKVIILEMSREFEQLIS